MDPNVRDRETVETTSPAERANRVWLSVLVGAAAIALLAGGLALALSPALRARLFGRTAATVPLRVTSTPEGAEVFIDDHLAGTTPLTAQVTSGPHRVRLVRRGHRPWHEEIDAATTPEVAPTLARVKLGRLLIESEPDRADVLLNDERRGTTPLEIGDIEAGSHTLRVLKDPLYQPATQHIELKEGETRRIVVHLESGLERLYEERIKKTPGKLSNYTELLHLHLLNDAGAKAAAVVAQAASALKNDEVTPTELGQFFQEVRKLVKGQAAALDAASRDQLFAALAGLLEKLVLAAPAEYPRYSDLVVLLSQAERFGDIYKICEKTVALPTGGGLVHYYVATACLGVGETTSAIRLLERAVELKPALYTARLSLASAYHRAERLDDALRQYTEAEKAIATAAPYYQGTLHVGIARLMVSRKDIPAAIERFKKAIAIEAPPAYQCQWRLQFAELLLEQGKKNEATEQYNAIIKLGPETDAGYTARRALRRLGER